MIIRSEYEGRTQLVEFGRKLVEENLVQGTWGNLSVRLDDQFMICTPSGMDYERATPEDMVVVELKNLEYLGDNKPTSEKSLHATIYQNRPEVGAVIHTHSKYCSIFAAAEMPIPVENSALAEEIGDVIRIANYGLAGTKKLTKNTMKALGNSWGCIMAHHGMICCGKDIFDAYEKCRKIEEAARQYVDARV